MDFKNYDKNILFIDIETVSQEKDWGSLCSYKQRLFDKKTQYARKDDTSPEEFYKNAGIWAEFGKIVCISVAFFRCNKPNENERQLRVKSFFGYNERDILLEFKELLDNHHSGRKCLLCAHNGKEFDFPYIARRMIILQIKLPDILNLSGKKPWEIAHIDTMEMWKFGDYKHFTSLELLASILNIPTPKDDIDGSQVASIFYEEKNIKRIARYCEKDTVTVAQLFLRFKNEPLLNEDEIITIK
ncbi:3'-5' exonuclease [Ichthyobacterium seriolicida]|uniref:3'-5' exonuclease n=1 Tax=Ichthyobacterium seriolicida TaxID=242600 RepID=A0A1J1E2B6_9FLAO|nr:3'-5' exonuclease [Ichthyobacterium seriolicida]BAV94180.1 3'-5' exonuclease [Ichthyobacterium seriolicida]